jgi:hypothetical protein
MPPTISEGKSLSLNSTSASPEPSATDEKPKSFATLGKKAMLSPSRNRIFPWLWTAANVLLLLALCLVSYSVAWEENTRVYLKGFSDAMVPVNAAPIDKIESILAWMANGPHQQSTAALEMNPRDPEETLNYRDLLRVCGTATNAFINIARSSDLQARRLLLTDHWGHVVHVVAEVQVDGQWIVVDPLFQSIMRDSNGHTLTRRELSDPATLAIATRNFPGYDLTKYRYDRTERVRLAKIPLIGNLLRPVASHWPNWSDSTFWTMLVERESFGIMILSFVIFVFLLFFRVALRWYAEKHLGLRVSRIRTRLTHMGAAWSKGGEIQTQI